MSEAPEDQPKGFDLVAELEAKGYKVEVLPTPPGEITIHLRLTPTTAENPPD